MSEIISLTNHEYGLIKNLIHDKFGIHLGENKKALIAGRLNKIVKQNEFQNFKQYYNYLLKDATGVGMNTLINRISTNHTYFFREKSHLEYFSKILLPNMVESVNKSGKKSIRIWSCGCSSGEEAYILAMLMLEFFGLEKNKWELAVLGIDISAEALKKARRGIYSKENIKRLPVSFKYKYFHVLENGVWQINDEVKELVLFRRMNLMKHVFPFKRKFHTIFCRNVMIYFDQPIRDNLIHKLHQVMKPGGHLFVGLSESLGRSDHNFRYVQPGVYKK